MEMFASSADIKLLHVPFRGAGPALTALLGGTVRAIAAAPGTLKPQVEDGKLRVLGNCGAQRIASFPDVSPRLSGCAGLRAIRRDRQHAADRGGEDDRQGGVGSNRIFTFCCWSRTGSRLID